MSPSLHVHANAADACQVVAQEIAQLIRSRQARGEPTVLGLATGRTPIPLYESLVRMHREEGLSFQDVSCFNLDEYWPIEADRPGSFRRFMQEHFFQHVDLEAAACHLPDGGVGKADLERHCTEYEARIEATGGIDLQLLGIGKNGHIGFNEPGSERGSRTRLVRLTSVTLADAEASFPPPSMPPEHAITMGIETILRARRIRLLAFGTGKAAIVNAALSDPMGVDLPASWLQEHQDVQFQLDGPAASRCDRSGG